MTSLVFSTIQQLQITLYYTFLKDLRVLINILDKNVSFQKNIYTMIFENAFIVVQLFLEKENERRSTSTKNLLMSKQKKWGCLKIKQCE